MRILQLSKETKNNILEDLLKQDCNKVCADCGAKGMFDILEV